MDLLPPVEEQRLLIRSLRELVEAGSFAIDGLDPAPIPGAER